MNDITKNGFQELTYDEQCELVSAGSFLSVLGAIGGTIFKAISGILPGVGAAVNAFSNISTTNQQNKLIEKIKEIVKGEIEFGKDGAIKVKWDHSSNNSQSIPKNTIIF